MVTVGDAARVACNSTPGEVDLLHLTRRTIEDYMESRVGWAGSRVERELAHAANRVNYNQVCAIGSP